MQRAVLQPACIPALLLRGLRMRGAAWLAVSAEWVAHAPLHVHLELGPGADGSHGGPARWEAGGKVWKAPLTWKRLVRLLPHTFRHHELARYS